MALPHGDRDSTCAQCLSDSKHPVAQEQIWKLLLVPVRRDRQSLCFGLVSRNPLYLTAPETPLTISTVLSSVGHGGGDRSNSGAQFIRVDLHVHTFPDDGSAPAPPSDYLEQAALQSIGVLGITDHNTTSSVREFIRAAEGTGILVLPGIEVTTHQGHLLALFAPDRLDELEAFAAAGNLQLQPDPMDGSLRSSRAMLDLVSEVDRRGGLAIPAHVDVHEGISGRLNSSELVQLISSPGLAGLEFANTESLAWFTAADDDPARRRAWQARIKSGLGKRGLAYLMSSDAHSPAQVGRDRSHRTITRLRLDDMNFTAVRNAILLNPKARCKVEVQLPPNYPRVTRVAFQGGFLDGVDLSLSPNLTCVIGGRGSGKSTALVALRAALGAPTEDEDPDLPGRMPDITTIEFIDELGSARRATRVRGGNPVDDQTGAPVTLPLADLGQDESGRLAGGYTDKPQLLLHFLDQFCDLREHADRETQILNDLAENGRAIVESRPSADQEKLLKDELSKLEGSLVAAEQGKLESLVRLAVLLTSHGPLLDELEALVARGSAKPAPVLIDINSLAEQTGAVLNERPALDFVEGSDGLRARLSTLAVKVEELATQFSAAVTEASAPSLDTLAAWRKRHDSWQRQLRQKRTELEAQGLKVQAGELERLAKRREVVRRELAKIQLRKSQHDDARKLRRALLAKLNTERHNRYLRREATLSAIVEAANATTQGLELSVTYQEAGMRGKWSEWLGTTLLFRSPRVSRLAAALLPGDAAQLILTQGQAGFEAFEANGERFFDKALLDERWSLVARWDTVFELDTMLLEDRPRIQVREPGGKEPKEFDALSAGQQRSVLLSLLLCAERSQPLVLDQPEDHLDAQYIATAVVGHLERAKEHRQVVIATHSPNLTVLGDAELVIPMMSDGRHGQPVDLGSVDRPETRRRVCDLLEGGEDAYARRGERYGLRVTKL